MPRAPAIVRTLAALDSASLAVSVLAAGAVSGARAVPFLAAAAGAAAALWRHRLSGPVAPDAEAAVLLDPARPDPALLRDALDRALAHACERRRPVRLRLTALRRQHDRPALALDLSREGHAVLLCGTRPCRLSRPGAWIPDHPLPLSLPHDRSLTLLFCPASGGRAHVSPDRCAAPLRPRHWLALAAVVALACALDLPAALAAALGFACQARLAEQQAQRAQQDPGV